MSDNESQWLGKTYNKKIIQECISKIKYNQN